MVVVAGGVAVAVDAYSGRDSLDTSRGRSGESEHGTETHDLAHLILTGRLIKMCHLLSTTTINKKLTSLKVPGQTERS